MIDRAFVGDFEGDWLTHTGVECIRAISKLGLVDIERLPAGWRWCGIAAAIACRQDHHGQQADQDNY